MQLCYDLKGEGDLGFDKRDFVGVPYAYENCQNAIEDGLLVHG